MPIGGIIGMSLFLILFIIFCVVIIKYGGDHGWEAHTFCKCGWHVETKWDSYNFEPVCPKCGERSWHDTYKVCRKVSGKLEIKEDSDGEEDT